MNHEITFIGIKLGQLWNLGCHLLFCCWKSWFLNLCCIICNVIYSLLFRLPCFHGRKIIVTALLQVFENYWGGVPLPKVSAIVSGETRMTTLFRIGLVEFFQIICTK
jgi:hypothetical protein